MKKYSIDTEKSLNEFQFEMMAVPSSLTKKLHSIPNQLFLSRKETRRLIIWAAASCILLLGMNFFALRDTIKKQQSSVFTSSYFDYLTTTP